MEEDDLDRLRHYPEIDDQQYEKILEEVEPPFVYYRHRENTPLKNNVDGQRPVALSDEIGEILRAYIRVNRIPVSEEDGRQPLFTTEKGSGRMSKGAIRRTFYLVTQPCRFGLECPHSRDPETCTAREHGKEAQCPSARSPHPIRTGAITNHRDEEWPPEVLSERANATPDVIRDHYDHPQLLQRMQSRRDYLDDEEADRDA